VVNRCPRYTPFPAGGPPPPERGRTAADGGPAPRRVVRGADPTRPPFQRVIVSPSSPLLVLLGPVVAPVAPVLPVLPGWVVPPP
jgi:hypothetical protein